jgi:hypothetical protein
MKIPVAANIGEIVDNVIRDCPRVTDLWAISERSVQDLDSSAACEEVCGSIAEAFAEHSVKAEKVPWSPRGEKFWSSLGVVHRVILLINAIGLVCGVALSHHPSDPQLIEIVKELKEHEGPLITAEVVAVFAKPIMHALRTGQAYDELDTKRDAVRRIIFSSLRSGAV